MRADVIALAIELGWVVRREEDVEQVVVAELRIVEGDADRFGMAGIAAADLLVGWVRDRSAGIAALDLLDPDDIEEHGLGAPEAPAREDCDFVGHHPFLRWGTAEIGGLSAFGKTP